MGGWGKHIPICLRLAQTALYCALGHHKDTEQMGFVSCPLRSFRSGDANQKLPFHSFSASRRRGVGRRRREKGKEVFGFARASPRARLRRVPAQSERTKNSQATTRSRACEVSRFATGSRCEPCYKYSQIVLYNFKSIIIFIHT